MARIFPQLEALPRSTPSDHLLKTFAAVPVSHRVLDLGCAYGRHTEPLARLGFEIHAVDTDQEAVATTREKLAEIIKPRDALRRVVYTPRFGALGYPDAYFDWLVAYGTFGALGSEDDLADVLSEARRVLKSGGWIYVAVPGLDEAALTQTMDDAGFALAEAPALSDDDEGNVVRGIYRRVDAGTAS